MLPCKDISRWQGDWVDTGEPIVMVKISGGDDGLYIDSQAANNYNSVINAGKAFGGYHFAGGTDPIGEANFYLNAMQPWNHGEVPALDWEIQHPDPVGWCNAFVTHVHDVAGAWPLIYMNLATLNAHDWTPVLQNCGLWLADWNNDPNTAIDTGGRVYVMQQYNDGPNYDHDEWFGTLDEFKLYGWPSQEAVQPPAPEVPSPPIEPTEPTPEPPPITPDPPAVTPPPDVPPSTPSPAPIEPSPTPPPVVVTVRGPSLLALLWAWLVKLFRGA